MKPFSMNYAHNPGPRGSPKLWRAAFHERMGLDAARATLRDDSPHSILGVSPSATWSEIKRAYHALARIHHPDIGGDPAAFRRMQAAFEVLEARSR